MVTRYLDDAEPPNAPSPGQRSQLHRSQQVEAHFTGRGSYFLSKTEHPLPTVAGERGYPQTGASGGWAIGRLQPLHAASTQDLVTGLLYYRFILYSEHLTPFIYPLTSYPLIFLWYFVPYSVSFMNVGLFAHRYTRGASRSGRPPVIGVADRPSPGLVCPLRTSPGPGPEDVPL